MAAILSEDNLEMVRKAIGVEVDARVLPDSTIGLPIYQGAAERWARGLDSTLDTKLAGSDEDIKAAIINAVALKTASLLVMAFPFLTQEQFGHGSGFTRQTINKEQLAESLASRAVEEINSYLNPTGTPASAFLPAFTVARSCRGR